MATAEAGSERLRRRRRWGRPCPAPPEIDPRTEAPNLPPIPVLPQRLAAIHLLSRYIAACGGAVSMTRAGGGGTGGGGGTVRGVGRAAARTGRNLGTFAARVGQVGLAQALREFDLGEFVGRSAGDVVVALVDRLCGPGSTMDEALSRSALTDLQRDLLGDARTFAEVEERFSAAVARLEVEGLMVQFYGYYLYEMFIRDFYERLIQRREHDRTAISCENIKRTIRAQVRGAVAGREVASIDWRGREGRQLAEEILTTTFAVFEVAT